MTFVTFTSINYSELTVWMLQPMILRPKASARRAESLSKLYPNRMIIMLPSHFEGGLVPVIVDTREQLPYNFDPKKVEVTHKALASGDYSLVGWETQLA